MEFNAMIIKLLKKDSEARSRKLGEPKVLGTRLLLGAIPECLASYRHPHVFGRASQRRVRSDRMGPACGRPSRGPEQGLLCERNRFLGTLTCLAVRCSDAS